MKSYEKQEVFKAEEINELSGIYKSMLTNLHENPYREGLVKTPERAAKAMKFLTHGYEMDPKAILESALFKEDYSQIVVVKDIEIYSLCEHHLLPFFGKAHVGYIPNGTIVGLTSQINSCLEEVLHPKGVAVVIEAQHLCMSMRGIQKQNSVTTTSEFTGAFLTQWNTRQEFMHLIGADLH